MEILFTSLRHTGKWALRLSIVLLLLSALLLALSRWLLPYAADYRPSVERLISAYLHTPVRINKLEAAWQGWKPVLRLEGLSVGDAKSAMPQASFKRASVSLDIARSVLSLHPVLSNIRLEGVNLRLERTATLSLRLFTEVSDTPLTDLHEIIGWIFHIRSLDLLAAQLQIIDTAGKAPALLIPNLSLSLRSKGGHQHLNLVAQLPQSLGHELQGTIELYGEAGNPSSWRATISGRGEDLSLSGWRLPIGHPASTADIALSGEWYYSGPTQWLGKIELQNPVSPKLKDASKQLMLLADAPSARYDFNWRRTAGGWLWQNALTGFDKAGKSVFHTTLDLTRVNPPAAGALGYLEGRGLHLRLPEFTAIVSPWLDKAQRALLADLAPAGELPELQFRTTLPSSADPLLNHSAPLADSSGMTAPGVSPYCQALPNEALGALELTARFSGLSSRAQGSIPGLKGLSGGLSFTGTGGRLDLDSHALQVNAAPFLRAPVVLDTVSGPILWRCADSGALVIESPGLKLNNPALTANLQGSFTFTNDAASPLLDVRVDYQNVEVGQIHRYLPVSVMHPKLVQWLDRALVSGKIPSGELTFRGHVTEFPFDNGQGLFEARLQVENAILDYFPDWPRIEELEAEVTFRNRSFELKAVTGKILNADLQKVQARISDFQHAVLEVRGKSRQSGNTLLRFLHVSPLAQRFGRYTEQLTAEGDNTLNLELTIPLDPRPNQVRGTIDFTDTNSLALAPLNIAFQHLRGQLGFSDAGLTAKDMRLVLLGEPARLDIDTRTSQGNQREIRFNLRGGFNSRSIVNAQASALASFLDGRGRWDAALTIPHAPGGAASPRFALTVASDLKGLTINLPPPLGKSAEEIRPLTLRIDPGSSDDTLQARLDYAPQTQAIVELADFPSAPRLRRGELRINAGEARLPSASGLSVIAHLPRLELFSSAGGQAPVTRLPSWLETLQARLDELIIGNQRFSAVELQASNLASGLMVRLKSAALEGQLRIPVKPTPANPLQVDLQHLALDTAASTQANPMVQQTSLNPQRLPPLRIAIQNLSAAGHSLGSLRLSTLPRDQGLQLTNLNLQSSLYQITASGNWVISKTGHSSRLQATLHSPDLGRALQSMGYSAALEGGRTEATLNADWPAPLLDLATERLTGRLSLHIGRGRLPNVKPGVGRVFGLFNLSSLSRRLALDFSDFFGQGLAFDRIDGNFTLKGGNAYTDDLTLKGPSAHIYITGRVGLQDRDYDQTVTVTPQVSSPLPIAGAIAGGPAIGAAAFIVERLLRGQIERATSFHYTMTGPWSDPVIIRKTPAANSPPFSGADR